MKCSNCATLYPNNYSVCPKCGSEGKQKQEYAVRKKKTNATEEVVEPISPFVESGEIASGELR